MRYNFIHFVLFFFIIGCKSNIEESKYIGGWPSNPNKDTILDLGFGECPKANGCSCESDLTCPENSYCAQLFRGKACVPIEGSVIPRFKGLDQYGDEFDLYDLANQGKPIIIEIGNTTASACQHFASWKAGVSDQAKKQKWWKNKFERIRDLVNNQEIFWVHFIHTDENKNPSTYETIRSWYEQYPNKNIIILSDPDALMKTWIRPTGMPCLILADENMVMKKHSFRGIGDAVDMLYEIID